MEPIDIILRNVSGVIIIMFAVALTMIVVGGLGLWLLDYSQRQRIRRRLKAMHEEIWDGYASSEYYCWLRVQWELERRDALPPVMKELEKLIQECRARREKYRQIILETGRPIKVRKTENEG